MQINAHLQDNFFTIALTYKQIRTWKIKLKFQEEQIFSLKVNSSGGCAARQAKVREEVTQRANRILRHFWGVRYLKLTQRERLVVFNH